MRRIAGLHWIKHSHLFDPDEYECSRCGAVFKKKYPACPNCGISLGLEKEEQDNSLACYQLFNFFKADPKKHCKTYMVESL